MTTTLRALATLLLVGAAGSQVATAKADVTGTTCTVSSIGWREDIKAMRFICGDQVYWNRETTANPSCEQKTSLETIKLFQSVAQTALLSGKSVQVYYDTQSGCGPADLVVREMYLLQ
jgi:hypothetical protein